MLLTEARKAARTTREGDLVPLGEQDRALWDRAAIAEGTALVTEALGGGAPGPYRLQAAIAALHDEAPSTEDTDWPQILELYLLLARLDDNPVVTLNRAVATAMVHGPRTALAELDALEHDPRMARSHRVDAVRAHLVEMDGDAAGAALLYRRAARRTTSVPERRYLERRAAAAGGRGH
jgi:predicted RNA polymerase sigma factor